MIATGKIDLIPNTALRLALTDIRIQTQDYFRAVIDRRRIFLWYVAGDGVALGEAMRKALDLVEADLERRE